MIETTSGKDASLQRYILLVAAIGWIAVVAGVALLMRVWIPGVDLTAELAALEEADTEQVDLGRPLPQALQPLSEAPPSVPVSGSVYLPLYSKLYVGGRRSLMNLSATLSLRNTSDEDSLIITSLTYFAENGDSVATPIDSPHVLAPMSTAELYVDQSGTGEAPIAAAVVRWGAAVDTSPPLFEAVVVGKYGARSISFVSHGVTGP